MKKMQQLDAKQPKDFNSKPLASEDKKPKKNNFGTQNLKITGLTTAKNANFLAKDKSKNFNLLEFLLKDSDRVLIIALVILLMDDEKNFMLMLALLYILI